MWAQNAAFPAAQDRQVLGAIWPTAAVTGMAAAVATLMNITVARGACSVPDPNTYGAAYLCISDATDTVTIGAAPPSGQNRIDVVTVMPRDSAVSGTFNDWLYNIVVGTVAVSPTVPVVPAGQVAIVQVAVTGGATSLVAGNLTDIRPGALAIPAPPAATTSATIQTYTDASGEVWVAKAGVKGGQYRKARDVLYSRLALSAAAPVGTPLVTLPWDTTRDDLYGLGTLGASAHWTIPAAGLYLFTGKATVLMTAPQQYAGTQIRLNGIGLDWATPTVVVPQQINIHVPWTTVVRCNAGDSLDIQLQGSVAGLSLTGGTTHNWAQVEYLGSG
jgi:hypothetical protein